MQIDGETLEIFRTVAKFPLMTPLLSPPWEAISPVLTGDRLDSVARIVVEARAEKLKHRHRFDGPWNLGCDFHAWTGAALREAANGHCREWLMIESAPGDLDFRFAIGGAGGVPLKWYRPDCEGQPAQTLKQSFEELRAYPLSFEFEEDAPPKLAVRIAVETGDDGKVTCVSIVTLDETGGVRYAWPIWRADDGMLDIRSAPLPAPIVPPVPPVGLEVADSTVQRNEVLGE